MYSAEGAGAPSLQASDYWSRHTIERRRVVSATIDALLVVLSPILLWFAAAFPWAAVVPFLGESDQWAGGYLDRVAMFWLRTVVWGVTTGLGFAYAATVCAVFGLAYLLRYGRRGDRRSAGMWYTGLVRRDAGSATLVADEARADDPFRRLTARETQDIPDAPARRRAAAILIDVVMLAGAPPWWLLLPGPALLIAEIILLVLPVFLLGLIPRTLAMVATRDRGTRVATVGQVIAGLRPAQADQAVRLVRTSDLPPYLQTPRARVVAAWVSFATGLAVGLLAIGLTVWLICALVRQSQIVQ